MEHPRTHSATATANTPSSTRNSSTSSNQQSGQVPSGPGSNSNEVTTDPVVAAAAAAAAMGVSNDDDEENLLSNKISDPPQQLHHTHTHTNEVVDPMEAPLSGLGTPGSCSEGLTLTDTTTTTTTINTTLQHEDTPTSDNSNINIKRNDITMTSTRQEMGPLDNNNNLFKQFDSKTGQFMRTSDLENDSNNNIQSLQKEKNKEDLPPTENSLNIQSNKQQVKSKQNQPSFHLLSSFKSRSNSVPTILHSSLKRLSNHGNYYGNNPNHHNNGNNMNSQNVTSGGNMLIGNNGGTNQTIITHPMNPYGIMKKKSLRSHHPHILQSQGLGNSSSGISSSSTNALSNTTLRQAILLTQEALNSSTNSSKAQIRALTQDKYPNMNIQNDNNNNNNNLDSVVTFEDRVNYVKATRLPIPLPPINLQCLKEIDLQEIVKNPQLRHDIIFDPLLQFRPNLDGERGIKKKHLSDIYWKDVENELIVYSKRPDVFRYDHTRLVPLFDTLREVLLTIVPQKETHQINNILDTELNVQELIKGSLVMSNLSEWLATLFKHHCAPMRDAYVDKMSNKFKEADMEASLPKFMEGLKLVFQILEAMKLDIANHQIRLLRPALLSNAIDFEKQYFSSLVAARSVLLKSSLTWFKNKMIEYVSSGELIVQDKNNLTIQEVYKGCIKSIISLLSCRKMVREFPTSLSFDHARLILLRADIRQLVCLLVCRLLFQQLVANDTKIDKATKVYINATYTNKRMKEEVISIITDDHGNCRWTKNTLSIAVHLCKVIEEKKQEYLTKQKTATQTENTDEDVTMADTEEDTPNTSTTSGLHPSLDNEKIRFAKAWLSKQTQPLSEVYGVLENRVFKSLEDGIYSRSNCTVEGRVKQDFVYLYNSTTNGSNNSTGTSNEDNTATSTTISFKSQDNSSGNANQKTAGREISGLFAFTDSEEFENIYRHLYTVINLHWSVFGQHYCDTLSDRMTTTA
ncbi:similar to Saccharomyces cerevisiae YDR006C SOK1 Protein whose overexpression suppresses the growth defect of mutants lacking protein kinase A activity [Maudiozyma saulgeensis]|uniref:Similar to Saccharomyces cerevisiae YDR006C SOK1 Protein whose overexpression suppresses the growth defect of mutants lacking protein kinase A activity n=1 Tax=Maudiozyma saulgeensis TaxID=1789683 RepID=A0A1X7R439_9SACH|nr:similar to Saccharomyces cerevisiae YDR006C SOK1 Protein whose overexpression suppresses the growth defect of mutants lacking protein kinase A activity [Kazachstania saulgeensis]